MNCCKNTPDNGNKQGNKHGGHMSHMWMMLLCCGAPILLVLLLPVIGKLLPGEANSVEKIIPFLCPLMMLIMMPMMMRKHKGDGDKGNSDHCETNKNT